MRRHWPHILVILQGIAALCIGLACSGGHVGTDLALLLVLGSLGIMLGLTDMVLEDAASAGSRLGDMRLMAMFASAQAVLLAIGQLGAPAFIQGGVLAVVIVLAVLGMMRIARSSASDQLDIAPRNPPRSSDL